MGFKIDDAKLKRAGLDYWHLLDITYYKDLDDFFDKNEGRYFFFTTKAQKTYCEVEYKDGDYLFFGKETAGLPESLLKKHYDSCVRMPMREGARSLNLSNTVAIGVYEALRQIGFGDLETMGALTGRDD